MFRAKITGVNYHNPVNFLLRTFDVNSVDGKERTMLHCAAQFGHLKALEAILRHKDVNANIKDRSGLTPLCIASQYGQLDCLKSLLRHGKSEIIVRCTRNVDPRTSCLYFALLKGHLKIVEALLNNIVKDEQRVSACTMLKSSSHDTFNIRTMFHKLIKHKEDTRDLVHLLLKFQLINPNNKDKKGRTLLHKSAGKGWPGVVRFLLNDDRTQVNGVDTNLETPLFFAARGRPNREIVEAFLECDRVHINWCNDENYTILYFLGDNEPTLIEMLLSHKAFEPTKHIHSAQSIAAEVIKTCNLHTCKRIMDIFLLEPHGDPELPVDIVLAAAMRIDESGDIMSMIIDCLTAESICGYEFPMLQNPLHVATMFKNHGVVEVLLQSTAVNPNSKDFIGKAPIHYAVEGNDLKILNMFLKYDSVDVNLCEDNGPSPLTKADDMGRKETVKTLLRSKRVHVDVMSSAFDEQWSDIGQSWP